VLLKKQGLLSNQHRSGNAVTQKIVGFTHVGTHASGSSSCVSIQVISHSQSHIL